MRINTELFKESCKKILDAVDSNTSNIVSETLEIVSNNNNLVLNVTNREYYVSVNLPIEDYEELHAVVDAPLFLNLISKVTTPFVELLLDKNVLIVKANGSYKLPLIFNDDTLVELPKITIENVTNTFNIENTTLQSILKYNSKELLKTGVKRLTQKLYYLDQHGAITYIAGACVNNFSLAEPVSIALPERVVKLFKLFKDDMVEFTLGYDMYENIIQTKVQFKTSDITLTAIIAQDDSLVNSFPVKIIRKRANETYDYNIVVDKNLLLEAISRLSLFQKKDTSSIYTPVVFTTDYITLYDSSEENYESIKYINTETALTSPYSCIFNTNDLKLTLETCSSQFVTIGFGNHEAVVIKRDNVINVIPECVRSN